MPCTTILVGKKASNDGSTMIARTDDGFFDVKKLVVVDPKKQPKKYRSVISHVEIDLPENPMSYTSCPSVDPAHGIWAATGINACNVGMTATETITSNPRVLSADPMVRYKKAESKKEKDIPGGIGEEDIVVLVLPYIHTAKEGVERLASLLETYGTYESNGIAFNDGNEIWWMETIGGHHWMAQRVRDEEVVVMPNQFGQDRFDFEDAFGKKENYMCSADLKTFMKENDLDLTNDSLSGVSTSRQGLFNPRNAFGSHSDSDHIYNTPRAWFMGRYLNPTRYKWDGPCADFTPESDNIPWSFIPEKKVTVEDVKYLLSSYYQGTPYNPYAKADNPGKGLYRTIGINRTGVMSICQIRNNVADALKAIEWVCFGSTSFDAILPIYTNVSTMPRYLSDVTLDTSTENFYWGTRLIGAMADNNYGTSIANVERYQNTVFIEGRRLVKEYDRKYQEALAKGEDTSKILSAANDAICAMAKKETTSTLNKILHDASLHMKNGYNRADN